MSLDGNMAFVRRLFAEVWNEGNLAVLDDALVPAMVGNAPVAAANGSDIDRIK